MKEERRLKQKDTAKKVRGSFDRDFREEKMQGEGRTSAIKT
jgi:hypothetical protein